MRTSQNEVHRLTERFANLGDTDSIARLNRELHQLKSNLTQAQSGLDVRTARSNFADTSSSMRRLANDLEAQERAHQRAARSADVHADRLDALRTKYNPLYSASKTYESALEEIALAEREGAISANMAAQARDQAAQRLMAASTAADRYTSAMARSGAATQQGVMVGHQLSDVLITAQMGFQSVGTIMLQQGSQIASQLQGLRATGGSVFGTLLAGVTSLINPLTLLSLAAVGVGAAVAKWFFSAGEESKTFSTAIGDVNAKITELRSASETLANRNLRELRSEYGMLGSALDAHLERLRKVAALEAAMANADVVTSIRDALTSDGNLFTGDVDAVRRAFDTTNDRARTLLGLMEDVRNSRTFEDQAQAVTRLREAVESTTGGLDNAEGSARGVLTQLVRAEDASLKLLAAQNGTTTATNNAASAASSLSYEIGTAADAAAQLLANLNSVPAAINALQGSVADQLASIEASNRSLEIQLSEGLSAAAANRRVQLEAMVAAGANGERISFDQVAKASREIAALEAAEQRRQRLQDQLREASRTETGKGGGGGAAKIAEEVKAREQLNTSLQSTLNGLKAEAIALRLVNSEQFATTEGAQAMARAIVESGGAVDAQTAAMIQQIDAAAALRDQMRESVEQAGSFVEAMQGAAESVSGNLETALSDLFANGTTDLQKLGEAIRKTFADAAAGWVMDRVNLDGLLGGDKAGLQNGGAQAGSTIATSMVGAGQRVAAQINAAMLQGGRGLQMAHMQGGAQAANAARMAGAANANTLRLATTTSGQQHAQTVGQTIVASGQRHAQAVGAAAGGTTSGGGNILGTVLSVGSMLAGGFSEGGYSDRKAPSMHAMPISAFANAPHYAEGTPNTSGIPAVLHPNEAVVPLSRGRKIPVEMGGGGASIQHAGHTFNIDVTVDGGDEGGQDQALRIAQTIQAQLENMMDEKIYEQSRYGGLLNPR
ncbi:hypothetical protein SAMN05444340_11382 [Citreimonas salinaria]|uniref:Prophage tail length tape measure protein n=2 Tax=Citreimonas salinaria TaxID=321339 RepID=A0A1H3LN14_9RHOB|nr:hypothetical protein SAMN05444340_11382 [Citreimonas salinaria]